MGSAELAVAAIREKSKTRTSLEDGRIVSIVGAACEL